ncbi:MAG: hypothetical protein II875_02490 [Clostridia bacterium]|nr:hypothetical protein [Clostridia bacterium]
MAIVFSGVGDLTIYEREPMNLFEATGAKKLFTKEEFIAWQASPATLHPRGEIAVEVRRVLYDDDEWEYLTHWQKYQFDRLDLDDPVNKAALKMADYGHKWRAWLGDPTRDQMDAAPWDSNEGLVPDTPGSYPE